MLNIEGRVNNMIYITTHHRAINYGAALQSYALQQALFSMGYNNKLILVDNEPSPVAPKGFILRMYGYYQKAYRCIHKRKIEKEIGRFKNFFENYHITTEKYDNFEDLQKRPPKDGVYLSGSDQVFNPINIHPHFFLQFGDSHTKRISYAASVNVSEIPREKQSVFREYLSAFDALSIREQYSVPLIQQYYNKDVNVHVDPSFLLEQSAWEGLRSSAMTKWTKKPYILVYAIYRPKWLSKYLRKLHAETKCQIIVISYGSYLRFYKNHYIKEAGPQEFLELVSNAKMVLSSSYHGVVFASIFRKPFYAMVNPDAPARIMSLLDLFHLQDRVLTPETKLDFNIDYSFMESKLPKEVERAKKYLKEAIEG